MFGLIEVLKKNGHDVVIFSIKSSRNKKSEYEEYFADPIGGEDKTYFEEYKKDFRTSLEILDRQFYSRHVKKKLDKLIKYAKPDVAYLLHHQNRLSPSVIDACRENRVPVVMRISDFALVCTKNTLMREEKICEECIDKSLFRGVVHKCVKDSYTGSLTKAIALYSYRTTKIYRKVERVVVPSQFTLDKIKFLFDESRMTYLPTFVMPIKKKTKRTANPGEYALFVGRIEEEKGLIYAIKAFEGLSYNFKIAGKSHSGYGKKLEKYVSDNKLKNIDFLGDVYGEELEKLYSNSRFMLIPSIWYENMPNVALEAMSHGKPIVTSDLGSMKEIVVDNHNGLLFESKNIDELKSRIKKLFTDDKLCIMLGKNAYKESKEKYNPEKHYNNLITIFREVKEGQNEYH